MAISSDGHRELFPFLSDRVRKKKKKIETCQSASYFETREKTREGNKVSIQLNQVITKHLSDLVHVTTTESLSFSSLFCYPRVRRHVNEPKCKTVELKKLNKQKLAVWAGRVILFFILINLFFLFFFLSVLFSFIWSRDGPIPFCLFGIFVKTFSCVFLRWQICNAERRFFHEKLRLCLFHRRWIEARVRTEELNCVSLAFESNDHAWKPSSVERNPL